MYLVDFIRVIKKGGTGEASVRIIDDDGNALLLNKFIIDVNDGAEPVGIPKVKGTPIYAGAIVDKIKGQILDIFTTQLVEHKNGIFKVSRNGIEKEGD
jgi:hypothetical protein